MIFVGIDPGFTGAIGWIIVGSTPNLVAYDLPLQKGTKKREFDLELLNNCIYRLTELGEVVVGLENPTTRPGEGAERCKRFGEGIGLLKGLLTAHQIPYTCISPNLWKGRLGLPGKTKPGANKAGAQFLVSHYPQAEELVYGPRGGIKDGRLDALLIAHWMKVDHDKR